MRLLVYLALAALALWCIIFIDARAMETMRKAEAERRVESEGPGARNAERSP